MKITGKKLSAVFLAGLLWLGMGAAALAGVNTAKTTGWRKC